MVSGIQFVESILFWVGMALLFLAFVSACMESRHSEDVDQVRTWIGSRLVQISAVPLNLLLATALRFFRKSVDRVVSEILIDFEVSPFAASVVMAILSILLPIAAGANALLGGSPFLISVYACIALAIFVMGLKQSNRRSSLFLGAISLLSTFAWLVFGPIYAVHSLTNHILPGTFSHGVLGSVLVGAILYAGCAGTWMFYRILRCGDELSSIDVLVARFLFAVPAMYILYWLGLLAGHFAINIPSPVRGWPQLSVVVALGAFSFAAIMASVEWGVRGDRRGHGLAVIFAALVLSMVSAVAAHGLIAQELPFWLRLWQQDFSISDIALGAAFWTSHAPFLLWGMMIFGALFISITRGVLAVWSNDAAITVNKPFLLLSGALIGCAIVMFSLSVAVDVYVNVN